MRHQHDLRNAVLLLTLLAAVPTCTGACRRDHAGAAIAASPPSGTLPATDPAELGAQLVAAISPAQKDKEKALQLIRAGADVNHYHVSLQSTPLFTTTYLPEMAEVADALIAGGADVHRTNLGFTPLHNACHWANAPVAELLIAGGARINGRESDGFTPLHAAAIAHRDTSEACAVLLKHGADVNALDRARKSPLDYARERLQRQRAGEATWWAGDPSAVVDFLIAHGGKAGQAQGEPHFVIEMQVRENDGIVAIRRLTVDTDGNVEEIDLRRPNTSLVLYGRLPKFVMNTLRGEMETNEFPERFEGVIGYSLTADRSGARHPSSVEMILAFCEDARHFRAAAASRPTE